MSKVAGYGMLAAGAVLALLGWLTLIAPGWGWLGAGLFVLGWYLLRRDLHDTAPDSYCDAIDLIDGDIDILD